MKKLLMICTVMCGVFLLSCAPSTQDATTTIGDTNIVVNDSTLSDSIKTATDTLVDSTKVELMK